MIGKGNDCLFPLYLSIPGYDEKLRVRCGHCINCKLAKTREWSLRLEMESHYWKDICFITLTYNDDNLPRHIIDPHIFYTDEEIAAHPELETLYEPTLRPDHIRNFIKRLRKRSALSCRYFAVGEYGTKYGRSHYHIMMFGIPYNDRMVELISDCWPYGFVQVKPFFKETCTYIAGYVQKKLYGRDKYLFKLPEFLRCSHHLGERWILDNLNHIDKDNPVIHVGMYKYSLPRVFRKLLVKIGFLKESSMIQLALNQLEEKRQLYDVLQREKIDPADFWSHRIRTAIEKQKRKLTKRNKTGDI